MLTRLNNLSKTMLKSFESYLYVIKTYKPGVVGLAFRQLMRCLIGVVLITDLYILSVEIIVSHDSMVLGSGHFSLKKSGYLMKPFIDHWEKFGTDKKWVYKISESQKFLKSWAG